MSNERPKRRRWFQFKLRTLLIAILVLSLPLSWFAVRLERARRQREAVQVIEALGGTVWYYPDKPYTKFLCRILGSEFLVTVAGVDLCMIEVTDADLECLKHLDHMDMVELNCTPITDAGLSHLQTLTSLECLSISDTQVTDNGLRYLKGLTNLVALHISDTEVTSEGVRKLQQALPNCRIEY